MRYLFHPSFYEMLPNKQTLGLRLTLLVQQILY